MVREPGHSKAVDSLSARFATTSTTATSLWARQRYTIRKSRFSDYQLANGRQVAQCGGAERLSVLFRVLSEFLESLEDDSAGRFVEGPDVVGGCADQFWAGRLAAVATEWRVSGAREDR